MISMLTRRMMIIAVLSKRLSPSRPFRDPDRRLCYMNRRSLKAVRRMSPVIKGRSIKTAVVLTVGVVLLRGFRTMLISPFAVQVAVPMKTVNILKKTADVSKKQTLTLIFSKPEKPTAEKGNKERSGRTSLEIKVSTFLSVSLTASLLLFFIAFVLYFLLYFFTLFLFILMFYVISCSSFVSLVISTMFLSL